MAKTTTTPAPVRVRSLRDASPDYAANLDRQHELRVLQIALEREADGLREQMRSPRRDHGRAQRVGALVGDDVATIVDPATRLSEIAQEVDDLRRAVETLRDRALMVRSTASKVICEEVRGEYATRVAAVARSLIAAHAANRNLKALTNDLEAADVAWTGSLAPMPANLLGGVASYLREASTLGFIKPSEVPVELMS